MKTQVKKIGTSKGLILSPEFLRYLDADIGTWLDLSDVFKCDPSQIKERDEN